MTTDFWSLGGDDEQYRPWTLSEVYADVGAKREIIEALDIHKDRFSAWMVRREQIKLPKPVRVLSHTRLWSIQEWRDWFARWMDPVRNTERRGAHFKYGDRRRASDGKPFFTHDLKCPTCHRQYEF